jgi:phage terminase small subunit
MPPLKNLRQELFIQEYVKDADASRAYRAAGYMPSSDNTCHSCASQLLTKTKVKARLREVRERIASRVEVSAARVLNELGRLAFSDIRKVVGKNGAILDPSDWDDDTAAAVAGIETFKEFSGKGADREHVGDTQKLKLWDKPGALVTLAKHFKLLNESEPLGGLFAGANVQLNFYLPEKGGHARSTNGHAIEGNGAA